MIPRTVVVNGVRYLVERLPKKKIGAPGDSHPDKARIRVAVELAPPAAAAVYRHEVGHAAFYQSGAYTVLCQHTTRPDDLEEQLLDVFLPVFCTALGVK